jgi:hypothetical protein
MLCKIVCVEAQATSSHSAHLDLPDKQDVKCAKKVVHAEIQVRIPEAWFDEVW